MNRNGTALILIVLSVGIYLTFTSGKIDELKGIQAVNEEYRTAIDNSARLIKVRDAVLGSYNNISSDDKERLNRILPDKMDNIRLIIDVKDNIAASHGLQLKDLKTEIKDDSSGQIPQGIAGENTNAESKQGPVKSSYGTITLSFKVTASYQAFLSFIRDLESTLRVMDITSISMTKSEDENNYDFGVSLNAYWLNK